MRVTEELVYEYWDCEHCGCKAIRGDLESCSDCGHPRAEGIRFYRMEGKEETVRDGAHQQRFSVGADWVCAFCTALNAGNESNCRGCGSSHADSEKNYFETLEKQSSNTLGPWARLKRFFKGAGFKILLAVIALIMVSAGWQWYQGLTHTVTYTVTAASWQRSIVVMRYTEAQHSDWQGELKGDSIRVLSEKKEVRRYEKRKVGTKSETYYENKKVRSGTEQKCSTTYKSTGSGASKKTRTCRDVPTYRNERVQRTRTVPVYKDFPIYGTKVVYRSRSYTKHTVKESSGTDNRPKWPELALGTGIGGKPDKAGRKEASYFATFSIADRDDDGPEAFKAELSEAQLTDTYIMGKGYEVDVANSGEVFLPLGGTPLQDD